MTHDISKENLERIAKMQQSELDESVIYTKIAKFAKGEENKETLRRLAREERAHCEIWKKYTQRDLKPNMWKVTWYVLMEWLLGFTFSVKLM